MSSDETQVETRISYIMDFYIDRIKPVPDDATPGEGDFVATLCNRRDYHENGSIFNTYYLELEERHFNILLDKCGPTFHYLFKDQLVGS